MLAKLLVHAVLGCAALRCAGAGCVSSQTGSDTFVASRLSSSPDLELDHPFEEAGCFKFFRLEGLYNLSVFSFGFQKNSNHFFGPQLYKSWRTQDYSSFKISKV